MTANKTDFFNDLSSQISEPIYLTDKTDEVNEEIKHNHWVLTAPSDIVAQTTTADFLEFIQKVKDNYKSQLDKSSLDIDLTFYLWFEEPGELCFNFINSNHERLPFGCKLKYTDRPEEIVDEYLKSKYHDQVILWDELQSVETLEEIAEADRLEKELHDNFVLTVYQEEIKQQQ
ncbi:hypothetical protein GCM10027275_53010 [Rhabdobacter roseus]|uniref:Uncharacterized protein n=1 Tax=Rhabdobacter roseus TaxID=1655419 RepID=A0A840U1R5_9BACT|nr:hypothetical protein [Rhabdobacter roseus]MBB5286308.1 hypothetical protein [Rhabdobacter roseus]